jgi:hypothetical protein
MSKRVVQLTDDQKKTIETHLRVCEEIDTTMGVLLEVLIRRKAKIKEELWEKIANDYEVSTFTHDLDVDLENGTMDITSYREFEG